jgi:TetR/AcrR family transcriptional regulator, transcriptional repressor for nem operon
MVIQRDRHSKRQTVPQGAQVLHCKPEGGTAAAGPPSGCLVATCCTHARLFDRELRAINRDAVLLWRRRFCGMFEAIMAVYPPREPIEVDELADMVSTVLEGGIVMAKGLGEPRSLERQLLVLRSFVKLLFQPEPLARPAAD